MFNSLAESLQQALKSFAGRSVLTEESIKPVLDEVRKSLLEADVALSVTDRFVKLVREKSLGQKVALEMRPDERLVQIVHNELTSVMGGKNSELNLALKPPVIILMAGLQGVGKTTTTAKLARYLVKQFKKKVMTVSLDLQRPGAIEQLQLLSEAAGAAFFSHTASQPPVAIARLAKEAAIKQFQDVLIVDTAGRLALDQPMMSEIKDLHEALNPTEVLFVIDAMSGQDAAFSAKAFAAALPLTGVVLAKADGDSRGGAALSTSALTGCPIKFTGTGEQLDGLELFHPERIASRILGMGDMLSLAEEAQAKISQAKAKKMVKKIKKGKRFDFYDFRDQLEQMEAMGGMGSMLEKLPGFGGNQAELLANHAQKGIANKQMLAIVNSMTNQERTRPELIVGSRKRRIAGGSGTEIQDINRLLKQFKNMQKVAKKMKGRGKMQKMTNQLMSMSGRSPVASRLPKR